MSDERITVWCMSGNFLDSQKFSELSAACNSFRQAGYDVSLNVELERGFDIYSVDDFLKNLISLRPSQIDIVPSKKNIPLAQELFVVQEALKELDVNSEGTDKQVFKIDGICIAFHCKKVMGHMSYCIPGTLRQP